MKSGLFLSVLLFAASAGAQTDRKFIKSTLATERHLPFSSGVLVGHTLYVAGTTAIRCHPSTRLRHDHVPMLRRYSFDNR
jgi:hypothetical protein